MSNTNTECMLPLGQMNETLDVRVIFFISVGLLSKVINLCYTSFFVLSLKIMYLFILVHIIVPDTVNFVVRVKHHK